MEINVEEMVALAVRLHSEGFNCAQSVAMAYADVFGVEKGFVERLAFPFGGGMSGLREVCGCVSAAALVSSFAFPPADGVSSARNRQFVKQFAERFRAENGEVVCRRLLGIEPGSAKPKKPCREYVAFAARTIGEMLNQV